MDGSIGVRLKKKNLAIFLEIFSLKSDLNLHFYPIVVIGSPWKQKRNKSENLSKLPPTLMVILMGVKQ